MSARRDVARASDDVRSVADETAARSERFLGDFRATLEAIAQRPLVRDGGQAGIDAFTLARQSGSTFDVVITDLGMPHVDGRRVASAIKTASSATPVILLTGWGQRLVDDGDVPTHVDRVLNKSPKPRDRRAQAPPTSSAASRSR